MNIFITLKCGFLDSYYFIQQLSSLKTVEHVLVFRDEKSLESEKIEYVISKNPQKGKLKFIIRFFQLLKKREINPKVFIGIYEIPHGLLAVIAGKIRKIPSVVSIIGNPAYRKIRKGLRLKLMLWIIRNSTYVTVTGNNSKKYLMKLGISEDKIFILPNTIDLSLFKNLELKKEYDIVSLGRINEEKHVELIVKIVQELKKKKPNIKAVIGGTGPEKDKIFDLINKLD